MTIVYPLIKQSRHNDLELLYSLRSVEKHLKGITGVAIVGIYLPNWINPDSVTLINFKDGPHKQKNIRGKISKALEYYPEILFANDEHFILQDAEAENYPYYYSGELTGVAEKGARPLTKQLQALDRQIKHFDVHCPIIYKNDFTDVLGHFSDDCIIKSAYANYNKVEGVETKDLKINTNIRHEGLKREIVNRPFFSVGDYGINPHMKQLWNELYPNPSKYEIISKKQAA
jgi:hypothetical protein